MQGRRDERLELLPVDEGIHGASRILWEQARLPRILHDRGCDVVYTAANLGILRSRMPCVTAVRNMEPLVPIRKGTPIRSRARHALLSRLTLVSARRASRVVAVSEYVRSQLVAKGIEAAKIDVIYHGIDDLSVPTPRLERSEEPFVFAAAKFVRYANLELVFRAFAALCNLGYRGELRLAGGKYDQGYEAELKILIRELGIADRVRFLGYISRSEMQLQLATCDVMLFSSVLEACPFTLLEALWQGTPVVATTAPPMPEFGEDGAIYVDPTDFSTMAEQAWRLISKPEHRTSVVQKARDRSRRFRWDENVEQLLSVLAAAAGSAA
jgi:glycosyltransferase involved in cell wall biosynthesis